MQAVSLAMFSATKRNRVSEAGVRVIILVQYTCCAKKISHKLNSVQPLV